MTSTAKPTVIFRADGSARTGLGHLFRCAALSRMLRPYYRTVLQYAEAPPPVIAQLRKAFDELRAGPQGQGERSSNSVVVFDGYHFGPDDHAAAGPGPVVCIDDIHAHPFDVDLVINHAPIPNLVNNYRLGPKTTFAGGLAYALLRPAYLEAARRPIGEEDRERFFICFGGSDHRNVTTSLLRQLTALGYDRPVDVVLGAANVHTGSVTAAATHYPGEVHLYHSLDDTSMLQRYQHARLAFLPASTVLVEAMAAGVPTITGYYVDNQINIYRGICALGLSVGIGDWNEPDDLRTAIERVQEAGVGESTAPARRYVDGYSDLNLRQLFDQLPARKPLLAVRPAQPGDMMTYFHWANDPGVRSAAIQTAAIPLEDHRGWFHRRLDDKSSLLLIFHYRNAPCGQLRYDLSRGTALVDISVDPTFRGGGLARRFLALGEEQLRYRHPDVERIEARVRPENAASARTFAGSGFARVAAVTEGGLELLRFEKRLSP